MFQADNLERPPRGGAQPARRRARLLVRLHRRAGPGPGQGARRPARLRRPLPRPGPRPGRRTALRFRVPDDGTTCFTDLVRGEVTFENKTIEDFVLLRSTACRCSSSSNALDDADMGDHPRHPGRGPRQRHAEVPADPRRARPRPARGVRPPADARERGPQEAVEAPGRRVGRRLRGRGLPARGDGQLPGPARVGPARRRRGPPARGDRRAVPARGRHPVAGVLRRARSCSTSTPSTSGPSPTDEFLRRARPFLTRATRPRAALEPLAALVQERVRLLTEVEPMIDFLLDDEPERDEDVVDKAMVKGKAAPEMLDAADRRARRRSADWTARAHPRGGRGGRRHRRPRERRGPAAAEQGAGARAGGHHRPLGRPAAVRVARGAGARAHPRPAAGRGR